MIEQLPHVHTLVAHAYRCAEAISIAISCIVEGISLCTAVLRQTLKHHLSTAVSIHRPSSGSLGGLAVVADIILNHDGAAEGFGSMT